MAQVRRIRQQWQRYNTINNEGGDGFNLYTTTLRQAQRDEDRRQEAAGLARMAEAQRSEDEAWTKDVTVERRAAWKAWVLGQGGQISPAALLAQQAAQGWTLEQLKRQVVRHGL